MPKFSTASLKKLATAHPELQRLFSEVIKTYNCTILCGHRDKAAQDLAVEQGNSLTPWPKSKHNQLPSMAVDAATWEPQGIDWYDLDKFRALAKVVKETAERLGIIIQWGGDWQHMKDFDHFQLVLR